MGRIILKIAIVKRRNIYGKFVTREDTISAYCFSAFALLFLRLDERNKLKYLLDRRMLF